jgi:hypothetical protein
MGDLDMRLFGMDPAEVTARRKSRRRERLRTYLSLWAAQTSLKMVSG